MVDYRTRMGLRGRKFTDSSFEVGGSDHSAILLPSDFVVGPLVSTDDYKEFTIAYGSPVVSEQLFVYPFPLSSTSVIDGTLSGAIAVELMVHSASGSITLTKIEAIPVVISPSGTETALVSDGTVWTGTFTVYGTGSVDEIDSKGWVFGYTVNGQEISVNDRIGFRVKLTAERTSVVSHYVRLLCANDSDELYFSIPFVMG